MTILSACSGSIYRQRSVSVDAPVAITVDARQRLILSQRDPTLPPPHDHDPVFRRFCAEPSPDVFTVLGVAASGGGNFSLGPNHAASGALQGAFSSNETGATISRTQTVNMLREMMFRTCERYLSGAISREEFPIIAARDQRIMVSILAIEQLTGSITPRGVAITSSGNAQTGSGAAETVKALTDAQAAADAARDVVTQKQAQRAEADAPAGTCARVQTPVPDGAPPLSADDQAKLTACNTADSELAAAVAARDRAEAFYNTIDAASRRMLGTSSASTSGSAQFATAVERSASVHDVAAAVQSIVTATFSQDETQLMCIRVVGDESNVLRNGPLVAQCTDYLIARVLADRAAQERSARSNGLSDAEIRANFQRGQAEAALTDVRGQVLHRCAVDPARQAQFAAAVAAAPALEGQEDAFLQAVRAGDAPAARYLRRAGTVAEDAIAAALASACSTGGW